MRGIAILFVICYFIAAVFAAPSSDQLLMGAQYTFDNWLTEYMPHHFLQIDPTNYVLRKTTFERNLKTINEHNLKFARGLTSYQMGINQWTAFDGKEVTALSGYDRSDLRAATMASAPVLSTSSSLPDSVDWSAKYNIPVLNQGHCGSCYAHNTVSILNYYASMQYGTYRNVSRQFIVDCLDQSKIEPIGCNGGGTGGCSGATARIALDFIASEGGIPYESDYPYESGETEKPGVCRKGLSKALTVDGNVLIPRNNKEQVMNYLAQQGPLVVSIDASNLHMYSNGILDTCAASDNTVTLNHAVILVGYGFDDQLQKHYLKLQNSWSGTWGEKGYFRILLEDAYPSCHFDLKPSSGYGCEHDTEPIMVCGCLGVYNNVAYPHGLKFL